MAAGVQVQKAIKKGVLDHAPAAFMSQPHCVIAVGLAQFHAFTNPYQGHRALISLVSCISVLVILRSKLATSGVCRWQDMLSRFPNDIRRVRFNPRQIQDKVTDTLLFNHWKKAKSAGRPFRK